MAESPGGYYPPVGFHFKVEFMGIGNDNDSRFQSVSGLTVEYETESFKEGGENRFEHKLPVRTKSNKSLLHPYITLKANVVPRRVTSPRTVLIVCSES